MGLSILAPAVLTRTRLAQSTHPSALPVFGLGAVLALTVASYGRFLGSGFAATDSLPLVEGSRLANFESVLRLFTTPVMAGTNFAVHEVVYRPFVSLTFGIDYLVWGPYSLGYHLSNLGLHVIAVAAVWLLLNTLGLAAWSSFLGAALFALHPIVVATVPVIARRDSIVPVTAFVASAAVLMLADTKVGWRRVALWCLSLFLAAAALLSKESAFLAVTLLPLLLVCQALSRGDNVRRAVKNSMLAVPFLGLAAVLFAVRLQVLRGLGGMTDADLGYLDPNKYQILLGSYIRLLLWAFAGLAPSTREVWLRIGAAIVIWLMLTLVCLPRRQAVLATAGVVWLAAFAVFCSIFKIATLGWLAYFSLIGAAIVVAAGAEGVYRRLRGIRSFRPQPRDGWRATIQAVGSTVLLVGLLVFYVSSVSASALFHEYAQWQLAGDVEDRYMQTLSACVTAWPDVSYVDLERVPATFDDARPETGMLGVTLIEQYTAEAALRLAFPNRQLNVRVGSVATLHGGPGALRFSCVGHANGVEFDAIY
jgi:hypothetical protein